MQPCFFKLVSNYNGGKNHREGKRGDGEGCRQEPESGGGRGWGGVTFLSCVVPQLGSDRVRLEPKPPQYLGQRGAPALPPLQRVPSFPLCCLSSSGLSKARQLSWNVGSLPGSQEDREDSNWTARLLLSTKTSLPRLFPPRTRPNPEEKWSTAKEEPLFLRTLNANCEPVSSFKEFISRGRNVTDHHGLQLCTITEGCRILPSIIKVSPFFFFSLDLFSCVFIHMKSGAVSSLPASREQTHCQASTEQKHTSNH